MSDSEFLRIFLPCAVRAYVNIWGAPQDHDIIIRFVRVRGKPGRGDTGDCLQLSACDRAVIDHCSFSWSEDEVIDMWARSTNITIQWSI